MVLLVGHWQLALLQVQVMVRVERSPPGTTSSIHCKRERPQLTEMTKFLLLITEALDKKLRNYDGTDYFHRIVYPKYPKITSLHA